MKTKISVIAILILASLGCNSMFNRYSITGEVSGEIGSKYRAGTEGAAGTEKFSVQLANISVVNGDRSGNFGNSGAAIINCTSTQCATLSEGTVVEFNCYEEVHWNQPNEEECRFSKIVAAANSASE